MQSGVAGFQKKIKEVAGGRCLLLQVCRLLWDTLHCAVKGKAHL